MTDDERRRAYYAAMGRPDPTTPRPDPDASDKQSHIWTVAILLAIALFVSWSRAQSYKSAVKSCLLASAEERGPASNCAHPDERFYPEPDSYRD
jgi:hypothetical protein